MMGGGRCTARGGGGAGGTCKASLVRDVPVRPLNPDLDFFLNLNHGISVDHSPPTFTLFERLSVKKETLF